MHTEFVGIYTTFRNASRGVRALPSNLRLCVKADVILCRFSLAGLSRVGGTGAPRACNLRREYIVRRCTIGCKCSKQFAEYHYAVSLRWGRFWVLYFLPSLFFTRQSAQGFFSLFFLCLFLLLPLILLFSKTFQFCSQAEFSFAMCVLSSCLCPSWLSFKCRTGVCLRPLK